MPVKIAQISPEGTLVLPDELRERLKDTAELAILWNEDLIVMKPLMEEQTAQSTSAQDKITRFFDIADHLASLNEIAPLTEDEIQAEIEAYQAEKK
ncbi:MAG: hypothetical protein Fur0044_23710 [Anaerolineae bacterium]